jgi:predicted O-methyltransferase YrrM
MMLITLIIKKIFTRVGLLEVLLKFSELYWKRKYRRFIIKKKMEPIDTVRTHLTGKERYRLYRLSKQKSGIFVEIGSYLGVSACFIARAISEKNDGSKLYCIDTWKNDAMSEGKKDTYDAFLRNTKEYRDFIVPIRGKSEAVIGDVEKKIKAIDFLFIDSDHSYEGCKKDWELYSPFLGKGSYVIFHDIGWAEGVRQVVKEEVSKKVKEKGRLPNMWWGLKK